MRRANTRHAGLLACALIAGCSPSAGMPPITSVADSPAYMSLDDAAKAALAHAYTVSESVEVGGALVKCAEGYRYTEPVTNGERHSVKFRVRANGCELVGLYHTHIPERDDKYGRRFSHEDRLTHEKTGVPFYMAYEDEVRKLDKHKSVYVGKLNS